MGKMATVVFSAVAVTAQQDFFEITNASTRILLIHAIELAQSTEVADAQEEGLAVLMKRGVGATTGSGGSTPTPILLETNSGAVAATAKANNTTKMTSGTITTLVSTNWNIRNTPMQWLWTPEMRPVLSPSERFTVELATTPADSITMSGTLWFEEIG